MTSLACGIVLTAVAHGQELGERMKAELAAHASASLPDQAVVSIVNMTPVRGHVETINISRFDAETGYFEAMVANGSVSRRITGRAQTLIPLYAPIRAIRAGEKIDSGDFSKVLIPISHAPAYPIDDLAEIKGFEARRSLAAGRPVSRDWVGAPYLVARNDVVTVSYKSAHIRLTARARALEEGAVGDVIRVIHMDGGSVIEGTVSGPKAIAVK